MLLAAGLALYTATLGATASDAMHLLKRTALAATAAAAAFGLLTLKILPPLKPLWLSSQIEERFETLKPCPTSILASAG